MPPKNYTCEECAASYVPGKSNTYCDPCFKKLTTDLDKNKSVEDEITQRRFVI